MMVTICCIIGFVIGVSMQEYKIHKKIKELHKLKEERKAKEKQVEKLKIQLEQEQEQLNRVKSKIEFNKQHDPMKEEFERLIQQAKDFQNYG